MVSILLLTNSCNGGDLDAVDGPMEPVAVGKSDSRVSDARTDGEELAEAAGNRSPVRNWTGWTGLRAT